MDRAHADCAHAMPGATMTFVQTVSRLARVVCPNLKYLIEDESGCTSTWCFGTELTLMLT